MKPFFSSGSQENKLISDKGHIKTKTRIEFIKELQILDFSKSCRFLDKESKGYIFPKKI